MKLFIDTIFNSLKDNTLTLDTLTIRLLASIKGLQKCNKLHLELGGILDEFKKEVDDKNSSLIVFSLNDKDENGNGPLHLAALKNEPSIIEILLNAGADVNLLNKDNETAAHIISRSGSLNSLKLLIDYKADITIKNTQGRNALVVAAANNQVILVEYILSLLKSKNLLKEVDVKDTIAGDTALIYAAYKGYHQVVSHLLNFCASVNEVNNKQCPAIYYSINQNDLVTTSLLCRRGAYIENPKVLWSTASSDSHDPIDVWNCVEALINQEKNTPILSIDELSEIEVYFGKLSFYQKIIQKLLFQDLQEKIPKELVSIVLKYDVTLSGRATFFSPAKIDKTLFHSSSSFHKMALLVI